MDPRNEDGLTDLGDWLIEDTLGLAPICTGDVIRVLRSDEQWTFESSAGELLGSYLRSATRAPKQPNHIVACSVSNGTYLRLKNLSMHTPVTTESDTRAWDDAPGPPMGGGEVRSGDSADIEMERTDDSAVLWVSDLGVHEAARRVGQFFGLDGYRLESGTELDGTFGKGSAGARVVLGAFATRYTFKVAIEPDNDGTSVFVSKGMTGISGGLIGQSKMSEEFERVVNGLRLALEAAPSARRVVGPTKGSVRERLEQLDELHRSAMVTDEEYRAKRAAILDDL